MFETATHRFIQGANGVAIHTVVMGEGEPLLLLHGHPETYLMWHKVAGDLAHRFTVVMCDLRGYGDSDKPEGLPDHSTYSKRIMAEDCIAVMGKLGFDRFSVMGHDRGARVAYRMALDHPEVVNKLVLLDIVSTYDMYALSSAEFAKALFHWYLLTQDEPFPEDLILSSRKMYFRNALHIGRYNSENDTSSEAFPQEVYDEYLRHYNMECIHAICEEYRAGECIDRFLDKEDLDAGKKITAETLVLWGANGLVEKFFNPLQCWLKFCINVQGCTLPCGHLGTTAFSHRKELEARFKNNPEVVEETMEFMSAMGGSQTIILGFLNKPDYSDELLPSCIESVAAAMENMCLAAYDKGIASCWVEAVVRAGNALGSHFATGHGKLIGAIVLGYADMEPRPIKQKGARYVIR